MGTGTLAPVIRIDEEKCINCYACITACPVKYCMDGSGDTLTINGDLCIGCGHCIAVCSHEARLLIDDCARFHEDARRGDRIIAIVAPAIASFFPGKFLKLNGYLKSLGVEAIFDVSFGAELTVLSYINFIRDKNPRMVIAQPCPAIVTFIEIYHPELLPFLSPADSPMLHSIKMIREYYPQYRNHKIAVISPCIAKKREFDETGMGDYNITMRAVRDHLEEKKLDLDSYPAVEYIGAPAERAVTFSAPGGLLDTAERFVPGIRRRTRKIEGVHTIYPYLTEVAGLLKKGGAAFPLLVDCLNCEKGCNGGPGTGHGEKALDELEGPVLKRSAEVEQKLNPKNASRLYAKYNKQLNRYWKNGLYIRTYRDLSGNNTIRHPGEAELTQVYRSLRKFNPKDIYDCTACGYGSCKAMATAIYNKLNKPENCAHNTHALLEEEKKLMTGVNLEMMKDIDLAIHLIDGINNVVNDLSVKVGSQIAAVDKSSTVTGRMTSSLKNSSDLSLQKRESIKELIDNAAKGQESMRETIESVQGISQSVDGIASAIKIISAIAANTNLLAMNAAIEAAHAGDAGRGFAVVADEIRRLSETTRENSRNISQTLSNIIGGINITSKRSGETDSLINDMSIEINGFANTLTELIGIFSELSSEGFEISATLESLRELSAAVKTGYGEMLSMTEKLKEDMNSLSSVSDRIVI